MLYNEKDLDPTGYGCHNYACPKNCVYDGYPLHTVSIYTPNNEFICIGQLCEGFIERLRKDLGRIVQ